MMLHYKNEQIHLIMILIQKELSISLIILKKIQKILNIKEII